MGYFDGSYFDSSYFDTGPVVAHATGSGVGAGLSWPAESAFLWAGELKRRNAINMPTIAELEARISTAIARKRRTDEWILGLLSDAEYAQEAV